MNRQFLVIGLVGWLTATLTFRLVGKFILTPEGEMRTVIVGLMLAVPFVLIILTLYCPKSFRGTSERLAAVIAVAVPGMLLNALTTLIFNDVFPNMASAAGNDFIALMLWGYAIIILTGSFQALMLKIPNAVYVFTLAGILLLLAVPALAQPQSSNQQTSRHQRETREKVKAYRPIAFYEGGVFGYNRGFNGLVEREFEDLVMRNEKNKGVVLTLPLTSVIATYVETGTLGFVIKAKYHYLFVQYRDQETGVSGTAVFRFKRLEAADSVLNQIVVQLAMVKRGLIYVRPKSEKANTPLRKEEEQMETKKQ